MTIASEEILDRFDRLREPEKVEVAAAILKRLTAVLNRASTESLQEWSQGARLCFAWLEVRAKSFPV